MPGRWRRRCHRGASRGEHEHGGPGSNDPAENHDDDDDDDSNAEHAPATGNSLPQWHGRTTVRSQLHWVRTACGTFPEGRPGLRVVLAARARAGWAGAGVMRDARAAQCNAQKRTHDGRLCCHTHRRVLWCILRHAWLGSEDRRHTMRGAEVALANLDLLQGACRRGHAAGICQGWQ